MNGLQVIKVNIYIYCDRPLLQLLYYISCVKNKKQMEFTNKPTRILQVVQNSIRLLAPVFTGPL